MSSTKIEVADWVRPVWRSWNALYIILQSDMFMTSHVDEIVDWCSLNQSRLKCCVKSFLFEAARTVVISSIFFRVDYSYSQLAVKQECITDRLQSVLNAWAGQPWECQEYIFSSVGLSRLWALCWLVTTVLRHWRFGGCYYYCCKLSMRCSLKTCTAPAKDRTPYSSTYKLDVCVFISFK